MHKQKDKAPSVERDAALGGGVRTTRLPARTFQKATQKGDHHLVDNPVS